MLKKIKEKDIIDVDLERERTQDMLQKVYRENQFDADGNEIIPQQQELYEALLVFTGNLPMHKDVINVLARLFLMLSGDAAMSSVAPFPCHDLLNVCCDDALNNTLNDGDVQNLKKYSIELAQLLVLCQKHNCTQFGVDFCRCLMRKIKDVHKHNRPAPEVEVIPNTYDPSSGCTSYFTDTGEQVCKMPTYFVSGDRKARNPNFDDMPDVDPACSKLFPKISRSGFGYLFLWFCPVHGHSYGFHLIAGGEGRKDPFASLYKYCAHMPKNIYYDFACQLSEYCLNREPELFKNTRFWHDLFHFIGHLCGVNFKSGRVLGLEGVNTEICEQVNSFLQCIKYTGAHLSQDHFTFFLQFFLCLMNREKTKNYKKQPSIAVAGLL